MEQSVPKRRHIKFRLREITRRKKKTNEKKVLYVKLFFIISRRILLRVKNISYKPVEKIKTHILCSVSFFSPKSCRSWKNVDKFCWAEQTTVDNTAHALCVLDNWGSLQYVMIITFPLQEWLRERCSVLRYKYIFTFRLTYCRSAEQQVVPGGQCGFARATGLQWMDPTEVQRLELRESN
jgi:hypothetical protein